MPGISTLPDEELLHRLRSGDENAFTEIYHRYWEKLLAIGYYHTQDKQASEDIVHQVMISLWTRRSELKIQSLPAYLATAVKFAVFKAITRDKRRRQLLQDQDVSINETSLEEKLDARFLQEFLSGIVEELPEKARLVFHYSRDLGLSVTEIAGKMDLSPKAVEYHITKALRSIREALRKIKSVLF
jgi:RNA polymerase sigma-70 factor (ECF subfamily)